MLPKINPTTTDAWKKLQQHHEAIKAIRLKELFQNDPERFNTFSMRAGDILTANCHLFYV
jgi:glucose-6-phosphate isomerase